MFFTLFKLSEKSQNCVYVVAPLMAVNATYRRAVWPLVILFIGSSFLLWSLSVSKAEAVEQAVPLYRSDLTEVDQQRVIKVTQPTNHFTQAEAFEAMQGGAGTSRFQPNRDAFSQHLTSLSFEQAQQFKVGNGLFVKTWVSSPSSTQASDGVGPLFNARSCQGCHVKDGRGQLPVNEEVATSFLLQLARYNEETERWEGDPRYGKQFQTFGVAGHQAEGRVDIQYTEKLVRFADGEEVSLRSPSYHLSDLSNGNLSSDTHLSPRIAQSMIGMGLLEAISDADIIAKEDVLDRDGDGISGRVSRLVSEETEIDQVNPSDIKSMESQNPSHDSLSADSESVSANDVASDDMVSHGDGVVADIVRDDVGIRENTITSDAEVDVSNNSNGASNGSEVPQVELHGNSRIGRFGHKASEASVIEQSAAAFVNDMGLSTSFQPRNAGDCTAFQQQCLDAPHGEQIRLGEHEVPDDLLHLVEFYSSNLAPPIRRDVDNPIVLQGKAVFYESGCTACHTPKYVTSRDAKQEQFKFQLIWPYTDLLLHDMGSELADGAGHNGGATGSEWRTAPLWGIGLAQTVNPQTSFLHDGRARTLMEAVLWHGGEAEQSKRQVLQLNSEQRQSLVRFLESL